MAAAKVMLPIYPETPVNARLFDAPVHSESDRRLNIVADKYRKPLPKLAAWIETNIPESSTVFAIPAAHRKRLRTTNMLERLNKEMRRRTRVATLFPNEESLLRLDSAILMQTHEVWHSQSRYLNMKQEQEST